MDEYLPSEDLLVKYLDNAMTGAEKEAFEARLRSDPNLAEQLKSLQVAREAIRYYGIRKQVELVRRERKAAQSAKVISIRSVVRYSLAIASCAVLIIVGVSIYNRSSPTPDSVYRETYVGYHLPESRSARTEFSPIEKAYEQKNYSNVLQLAGKGRLSPKELLLVGISALETGRLNTAVADLEPLVQDQQGEYREDAEYYLALSYLKNKDYTKALPLFRKIQANEQHLYHQQISEKAVKEVEKLANG